MIMSLIIILPLISADTWFNKDPSIEQFSSLYFDMANSSINSTVANEILVSMINSSEEGTYPILDIQYNNGLNYSTYPGSLMSALSDASPLQDFMRVELI